MKPQLTGKQAIVLEAITSEMSSGKSFKEAVRAVMKNKQYNHMTVRRVAQKMEAKPSILDKLV